MACSDNTVRAGLTPKFKDVDTLCSDLTFEMSPPPLFHPKQLDSGNIVYAPPVKEFAVHKINVRFSNFYFSFFVCQTATTEFFGEGFEFALLREERQRFLGNTL